MSAARTLAILFCHSPTASAFSSRTTRPNHSNHDSFDISAYHNICSYAYGYLALP